MRKEFINGKDAKDFFAKITANGAGDESYVCIGDKFGFWCQTIVRSEELGLTMVRGQWRDGIMRCSKEFVFDNEVIDE